MDGAGRNDRGRLAAALDWVARFKDAVTPLALVVTVISLVVTSCISTKQLRLSALSFQGTMIYQALKDAREMGKLYHEGKADESAIFATMQSIYLEKDLGTIPDDEWGVFERDFCTTFEDEHLANAWQQEPKKFYSPKFVNFANVIVVQARQGCSGVRL